MANRRIVVVTGKKTIEAMEFEKKVLAVLRKAGFDAQLVENEGHPAPIMDIDASHTILGREMRFAIEVKTQLRAQAVADSIYRFNRTFFNNGGPRKYDECWIVTKLIDDEKIRGAHNLRHVRVMTLQELQSLLKQVNAPRTRTSTDKARTRIGKSVIANQDQLRIAAAALILLIDEKIEALKSQRPNSEGAIAQRKASAADYVALRKALTSVETAVEQFNKGEAKETAVVNRVKSFADGVQSWWTRNHERICERTFDMGVFASAVAICSMAGAVEQWPSSFPQCSPVESPWRKHSKAYLKNCPSGSS